MHIQNKNTSLGGGALKVKLTALTCILMGIFSTSAQAEDLYGCHNTSLIKAENANGCSASVGLNQKNDGAVFGGIEEGPVCGGFFPGGGRLLGVEATRF